MEGWDGGSAYTLRFGEGPGAHAWADPPPALTFNGLWPICRP